MMNKGSHSFDVVVMGAGVAGTTAAWLFASRGFRTALVEARRLGQAGARWVNGMPMRVFDEVGLERPSGEELLDTGVDTHMFDHSDRRIFTSRNNPMCNVDMSLLVDRLHELAKRAKVEVFDSVRLDGVEFEGERPRQVRLRLPHKGAVTLRGQLFVDATGMLGELRRRVPALQRDCPSLRTGEVCTAAQMVLEIKDKAGARDQLAQWGVEAGETVNWLGVEAGYSTRMISFDSNLDHAHIVTGNVLSPGGKNGLAMAREVQERYRFFGSVVRSGEGLIPIRRPYERLGVPGAVLLGDAACMVYSAHGSGVGTGMLAARALVESVAEGEDLGSLESVWAYEHRFHQGLGAMLGSVAVATQMFRQLSSSQVDMMVRHGIFGVSTFESGLSLKTPLPTPDLAFGLARLSAAAPALGARVALGGSMVAPVAGAYRLHPRAVSPRRWRLWARMVRGLMGGSA